MDPSALLAILPGLIKILPQILFVAQIMIYIFLIWFFGSIVVRGYKRHLPFPVKLVAILGLGFIALLVSVALPTLPILSEGIFKFLQLGLIVNGFIASIMLAISLYLLSYKNRPPSDKTVIEKLKRKVNRMEELLVKKAEPLIESEAKSSAEGLLKGYKAVKASLVDNEWEVLLIKGKKEAKIILDKWDGEIKEVIRAKPILSFLDPARIIGVGVIVSLLAFSLINFHGFPSLSDSFSNMFGISLEELTDLATSLGSVPSGFGQPIPEGCVSIFTLYSKFGSQLTDEQFLKEHEYSNSEIKILIEQNAEASVIAMYKIDYGQKEIILAIMDDGGLCYTTDGKFCSCMEK